MASSGTYTYAPEIEEFVSEAFERCGIDPVVLVARHARSARRSLNLMFADWANRGVHLFAVDEQTQAATAALAYYTAASGTLAILEAFVRRSSQDTAVRKISREEYFGIPDKTVQGLPTQLYFDRKTGLYYLWHVPENSTDVVHYARLRRLQDVTTGAETPDVPYRWYEALAAGLAAKLALKFAPDRLATLTGLAEDAFKAAKREDRERADTEMGIS